MNKKPHIAVSNDYKTFKTSKKMSDKKQIVSISWTDEKILRLEVFDFPEEQEKAQAAFVEMSQYEAYDLSYDFSNMTKEAFFERFIKPQIESNEPTKTA